MVRLFPTRSNLRVSMTPLPTLQKARWPAYSGLGWAQAKHDLRQYVSQPSAAVSSDWRHSDYVIESNLRIREATTRLTRSFASSILPLLRPQHHFILCHMAAGVWSGYHTPLFPERVNNCRITVHDCMHYAINTVLTVIVLGEHTSAVVPLRHLF